MGGTGWVLGGGEAGDDGAVLELDDVLLEDIFGVVELPELTVELESEVTIDCCCMATWIWGEEFWTGCWATTFLVWSVGMSGVLSSAVGVGGANLDGPGWAL